MEKGRDRNKSRRASWPRQLIMPSEKDFRHGAWVSNWESDEVLEIAEVATGTAFGERLASKKEIDELRYNCGTKACIVGWAALAIGERSCQPTELKNPATAKFLNKFMEFAGRQPVTRTTGQSQEDFIHKTAFRASDVFEGHRDDFRNRMSGREAQELWKKTAEHFGYDTENLVE